MTRKSTTVAGMVEHDQKQTVRFTSAKALQVETFTVYLKRQAIPGDVFPEPEGMVPVTVRKPSPYDLSVQPGCDYVCIVGNGAHYYHTRGKNARSRRASDVAIWAAKLHIRGVLKYSGGCRTGLGWA